MHRRTPRLAGATTASTPPWASTACGGRLLPDQDRSTPGALSRVSPDARGLALLCQLVLIAQTTVDEVGRRDSRGSTVGPRPRGRRPQPPQGRRVQAQTPGSPCPMQTYEPVLIDTPGQPGCVSRCCLVARRASETRPGHAEGCSGRWSRERGRHQPPAGGGHLPEAHELPAQIRRMNCSQFGPALGRAASPMWFRCAGQHRSARRRTLRRTQDMGCSRGPRPVSVGQLNPNPAKPRQGQIRHYALSFTRRPR